MYQHGHRGERGEGSEHPHRPDTPQQLRREARADEVTDVVARHDDAGDGRRKFLDRRAHAEEGAL